jgi:SPW repeat
MTEPAERTRPARVLNALLGMWLFLSGFMWDHAPAQRLNAWAVGMLCAAVALVALAASTARFTNTVLSAWLFASVWVLPHSSRATMWNDALVAAAVFALSLVPSGGERTAPSAPATG